MRILTTVFLALFFVACQTAAGNQIDGPKAHELVSSGATLLDVRTPQEYQRGHVEGAMLIPVSVLPDRVQEVPKDKPVVVYCQSGNRSSKAAAFLREKGYEVYDLGPMRNW